MFRIKYQVIKFALQLASFIFGYKSPPIPSVSAIIEDGKKILVIRLTYEDGYALPGGVLKGNEDFESAVRREIKEETGFEVQELAYFGSYYMVEPYSKVNVTYKVVADGKLRSSEEGMPVWMHPNNVLNKIVYDDNKSAVKEYLNL